MERKDPPSNNGSPTSLLTVACTLTIAALAWLSWNSYASYRLAQFETERNGHITELRGRILYLDEVLTMSARMAAATGAPTWEERYRTFQPQLDIALRAADTLAPDTNSRADASRTMAAHVILLEMDRRAFDLIHQGRMDQAQELLFGDEYKDQKEAYQRGMSRYGAPRHGGVRVTEVRSAIIHLTEVLMMTARMAATTGDLAWEARYRVFQPQMDAAIEEALAIEELYDHDGDHHAADFEAASLELIEIHNRAFELVRAQQVEEASALFTGDSYETLLETYAQGVANLASHLRQTNISISKSEAREATARITAILFAIAMTAGLWLVALGLLRQWHRRLTTANANLIAKGTELAALNTDLDQRVDEQTRELHDATAYTDNIIESMIDMLIVVAPNGNIARVNEATLRLLGYCEEELIGQPATMLFCEEAAAHLAESHEVLRVEQTLLRRLVGRGHTSDVEKSLRTKAGNKIPVLMSGSVMRDKDDRIGGIVCVAQDITKRKCAENELRKLSVAVEQSPATVVITDTNGVIEYVNPRFTEVTGYTKAEVLGRNPRFLKSGKWPSKHYEEMWRTIRAGQTWRGEFENKKKDGEVFWESASISPVRDAQGKVTNFLAIQEDITNRKRREEELRQAKRAAEAATRTKSEFLANMSHEIRTPMTAILGFAENMLEVNQCESEKRNCIRTIHRNGEYLLALINDILDLSKIEAGKMTIERSNSHPCRIVAEVASLMRARADAKGLSFSVEYIGAIPETIQSGPIRLRQILINLIGNAIKFTEAGAVRLVTRLVDRPMEQATAESEEGGAPLSALVEPSAPLIRGHLLQFDVIDTGCGLNEEQRTNLFRPFMQADNSTTRNFGGTGLGLTISKRFAEMLGGDITVANTEIGVGSTFRVTVEVGQLDGVKMLQDPMAATVVANREGNASQGAVPGLRGLRILLAEDGPDNRRLISFVLERAMAEVVVKENGQLAVDAALAALEQDRPFDCIVMDMQMPVMDGYEATSLLRRKGYTAPIIALTAHAMEGDRGKCISAGCDDYATKPIDRATLIETIRKQVAKNTPEKPPAGNTRERLESDSTEKDMVEPVERFVSELPDRVAAIERAVGEQEFAALAELAQQMKSSAGGCGFRSITAAAAQLQSSATSRASLEILTRQTRALAVLCRQADGGAIHGLGDDESTAIGSVLTRVHVAGGGDQSSPDSEQGMVLVVDDDPDARRLFRELLERDGFQVHEACDGNDALAKVAAIQPHVILMDAEMPNMGGLACTRELKAQPTLGDIPIIIVSGNTDSRDVHAGLEAGADEYITKPIRRDEFLLRVRAMYQRYCDRADLVQSNAVRGEQARAMGILFDLSRSLASVDSLEAIVAQTTAATAELMNSRRVTVMLPDETGQNLFVASAIGIDDGLASKILVPIGCAIAGRVFETGEATIFNSHGEALDDTDRYESDVFASAPLVSKALAVANKVVGVLNVTERQDRRPFDEREIEYLDLVCNMTASAIEQFQAGQAREHAHAAIVIGLAKLAEHRDSDTGKHLERVTRYALVLARELCAGSRYGSTIDARFLLSLEQAMPLHDIGKVSVPDAVLFKTGRLTDAEFDAIKRHPDVGANAIQSMIERAPEADFLMMAQDIARYHHERLDGSGYPLGLAGDEIPLAARIAAVADVYDALTTKRSYKEAFSHGKAVGIIEETSRSHFDPEVVGAFRRCVREFEAIRMEFDDLAPTTAQSCHI